MNISSKRFISRVLFTISFVIIAAGLILFAYFLTDEIMNPQQGQTGLELVLLLILIVVISSPFLYGGLFLSNENIFTGKTDMKNVEANPNNPLICHDCNQDYDETWKVCLKCGKPLVKKS